ncbi:MAG: class I tRNA ligase family protein [Sporichthyaceae bacterium]|nr:class I tRNA ligase family protein [Sporichthyaceae bacterium]
MRDLSPTEDDEPGGQWRRLWREQHLCEATGLVAPDPAAGDERPRKYVVGMFAYPSGDLHMGHGEAYPIVDAIARFERAQGHNVLNPVGWDSFGLPAENAARRRGLDPRAWTYANIAVQAASFRRLGISFDWRTRLHTSDPEYYRWNQWLFLRLFERGLAYRQNAPVNWCPTDETVLANEQVIDGRCERCGNPVVERELTQWFFRITEYADRLLADMALLTKKAGLTGADGQAGWPADVLAMQRNWIGRTEEPDGTVSYRLRDWLISRQRYWGTPIPIVHCPDCGLVPVPDKELPIRLPELSGPALRPSGGSTPLEMAADWIHTVCPACGGPARRDPDTMDTFVDSSWYFLRYPNPGYQDGPFDPRGVERWLPVDEYVGGKEHATGHLLYARFITKVLYDLGLVGFTEPFLRLTNQGQVVMHGRAMSKSLGNMVDLASQLDEYGPDGVRITMLFAGPPEDDIDWADVSPTGSVRWLARVRRLAADIGPAVLSGNERSGTERPGSERPGGEQPDPAAATAGPELALRTSVHRLIAETTGAMREHRFNVAVARLMSLTGVLRKAVAARPESPALREGAEALARMLSCLAPYTAEEVWAALGHQPSVLSAGWPAFDPELVVERTVTCVVQVDGTVRERLTVPPSIGAAELRGLALAAPKVKRAVAGRIVCDVVVRPPHVVNLVLAEGHLDEPAEPVR